MDKYLEHSSYFSLIFLTSLSVFIKFNYYCIFYTNKAEKKSKNLNNLRFFTDKTE